LVVLSHSVVLLDRLSSLMAGFILVLNHSWLCAVRSAQSSGSKLLRSLAACARVREAIDTGEGCGGACGPICIRCRNISLARNARAAASLVFSFMVLTGTILRASVSCWLSSSALSLCMCVSYSCSSFSLASCGTLWLLLSSSTLLLSVLSAKLVDRCRVGALGSGCLGAAGVPDDSRASISDSSLLVGVHSQALPPQSGHLFHDLSFVFVLWWGRFRAVLAAGEWSFVPCCLSYSVWRYCGGGFLVSECIGRGPLLSSSTGRVGVVGDFKGSFSAVTLVCGSLGRGWAFWVCELPSGLS
jgi:hypothetical protein